MPGDSHEVVREDRDGVEGVVLVSHEAGVKVAFAPSVGMVGYSLVQGGGELLGQRGGLRAYAERGSSFGIPLLHPWANRLAGLTYAVGTRQVELDPERTPVRLDQNGLPIHGLLAASRYWEVLGTTAGNGKVALVARLDFGAHEELMAGFPFPHELHLHIELEGPRLGIVTVLLPTSDASVPVAFGWHPYLCLPGVPRAEWHVGLPVRSRAILDERGIPTGQVEPVRLPPGPLGERVFDDLFPELERPAVFWLEGGGRRIEVAFDDAYPVAQVYAPQGQDFICFEPMTAPTNALADGRDLPLAEPSGSYTAGFAVTVRSA